MLYIGVLLKSCASSDFCVSMFLENVLHALLVVVNFSALRLKYSIS